ncbi:MAG TPA: metal ABC transporter permease [Spirochaetota bacterium]|nr:metal ABC transporter permease [Spirochaetota bacterium]HOS31765.1 metal ABC transporter permease [Spirochaetota bacterium]HOS54529.1 metal ABC transporter permease [Spirochaetota bacterium]HPK60829.1 metal ABC transporter permease [Spirochaetota bacterium]HQF77171.1 metal ABC transporter permease [Spirochaetota bacterium]
MELISLLLRSVQYEFIQKALLSGTFLAISSALLGVFLALQRKSLISDGLSHVSFATAALALLIGLSPLIISLPLVILASILINKLVSHAHIYSDSAIGLVSSLSIAVGVLIVNVGSGFNVDIYSYLFGSILAISPIETALCIAASLITIVLIIIFFNDLFLISYDEDYARISGINVKMLDLTFSTVQSVVIVVGIKIVGAMLISSLIIFPAITSLQIARSFKSMIIFSVSISLLSVIIGIFSSFVFNAPTGATIVLLNGILFLIFFILNKIFKFK